MKILYAYRYGILGGVCTQLWNRIKHIKACYPDWDVHLLFAKDIGIADQFGELASVHIGLPLDSLHTWAGEQGFSAVVVIDTPEYFQSFCVSERPYRLIAEVHTSISKNLQYLNNRTWEPDSFIVPSNYMKDLLVASHQVDGDKIKVALNCLDTELFSEVGLTARSSMPILLWVGKIDDHKDWRTYVRIAHGVASKGIQFETWLIGGQTCGDKVMMEVFESIEEAGLSSRFRWFDRIEYSEMPKLYSAVAQSGGCKLITSHNESFGMSLLEALRCNCPVVSTEVGALSEIAQDARFARFYPLGDLSKAIDEVEYFLSPENHAQAYSALRGQQSVLEERFSPAAAVSRYCAFVEES